MCGIRYEKWSGDMLQVWTVWRLAQVKNEVCVMMRYVTSRIRKRGVAQRRKLLAAKVTRWTWI